MTLSQLRQWLVCLAGACALAPAFAQAPYPVRPIELIVPYAPGGASDIIARTLAPELQKALGESIIIVNRAGANTVIGATQLARSTNDGYTLMLADAALMLNAAVRTSSPGYDLVKDFSTISQVGSAPLVLYVPPNGSQDVAAFVERGRQASLNIANAGPGSLGHLAAELLQLRSKANIVSVPYRGSGLAINETMAGQVDATFSSTASGMPLVESGRLRVLAVAAAERMQEFPDIPTFAELGLDGVSALNWWGVIAPAGLDPAIAAKLGDAVAQAVRAPGMTERFAKLGITPTLSTPDGFASLMQKDLTNWRGIVAQAKIQVD